MFWQSQEVRVGDVGVGGNNPIRIQSMTTCPTHDIEATIEQTMRLADAGCEIVRVTVQGMKEASSCEGIKNGLLKRGLTIPLVADIHFFPAAALKVADFVDKVRINPGNFVDKRATFQMKEYDDATYAAELLKIEEKFAPLVEKCKRLKRALRIGTNHGSLSDRIMNRYGDTAEGMVESALEFAQICRKYDYHDLIFSMKSSNPLVMVKAYRLLVHKMMEQGWHYPLHLGVTEAGLGQEGRVKSAMGIGSLLLDGIGDTIRVSLTEDPWEEIVPCKHLVQLGAPFQGKGILRFPQARRTVSLPPHLSFHRDGTVAIHTTAEKLLSPTFYSEIGCDTQLGLPRIKNTTADLIVLSNPIVHKKIEDLKNAGISVLSDSVTIQDEWSFLEKTQPPLLFLSPTRERLETCRRFFAFLREKRLPIPVILRFAYTCPSEELVIQAAAECGSLLSEGLGEGLLLEGPYEIPFLRTLSFNILQAARMRSSKTEFISCPSCGRTLFNLQEVTARIHKRTAHLPGVKIAIMGCIVNGPGEMADADFGYVGSKPGKIDLYVGKECVERDIESQEADERLVALIKKHGRWIDLVN